MILKRTLFAALALAVVASQGAYAAEDAERAHPGHPGGGHPTPHPSNPHPSNPHPSNPHPSNPHPSNPHPSNPHPSNPHPSNPHPSNPHPSNPHPGNPHPSNPNPSNPHPGNPHPGNPHPGNPHPGNPHPGNPNPSNPHPGNPHPGNPHPGNPHPSNPHPGNPHPGNPHPGNPHPGNPHPGNPHPGNPHPGNPNPGPGAGHHPHPLPGPHPGHGYVGVRPNQPFQQHHPANTVHHQHPSHLGSPWVSGNFGHATARFDRFRTHHAAQYASVGNLAAAYNSAHLLGLHTRFGRVGDYYGNAAYRWWHSPWYRLGFYGGYRYPVRPCYTIGSYFAYPLVSWFYVETPPVVEVWNGFYEEDVPAAVPQVPTEAFPYAGVYMPTDTFRDLLLEVSGLTPELQTNFRSAMSLLTTSLQTQLAATMETGFQLTTDDVVVTRYENLSNQGVVIEGFVDRGELHAPFRGFANLVDATQSTMFLPTTQEPNDADAAKLVDQNKQIQALGGDPYVDHDEPVTP